MKEGDKYNPYMVFQGCIVPNCIMKRADLTASAKLCFGRLSQYAGRDGFCYPSQKQLAYEIGTSESVIKTALASLITAKLIISEKPVGEKKLMHFRNLYKFIWNEEFLESPNNSFSISRIPADGDGQIRLPNKENHNKENHNKKQIQPSADFVLFWKLYPEKKDKAKSEIAFNKIKNRPSIDIILEAVRKQIEWRETANGDFRAKWKYPTTWLNGRCWEDEITYTEEPKQAWEK
jgi:hypothetical protein